MFPIFFGWCYSFSTIKSNSPFFGWRMNNVLDFNFNIFFTLIVNIYYYRYVAWARVSGPSSDCGSSGQAQVTTEDQIQFYFKSSKKSNNGTDVNAGQLPQLLYKLVNIFSNFDKKLNFSKNIQKRIPIRKSKDRFLRGFAGFWLSSFGPPYGLKK